MGRYEKGKERTLPFFIFLFFIALILYTYTLSPTVSLQDSGEYITSAYNLGIPHPPGNPAWCLLSRVFACIPISSFAYRINFMSAFFGALSIALSFMVFRHIFFNISAISKNYIEILSFILSLLAAVSPGLWKKAVVAEVHTLNLFFMLCIIFMILKARGISNRSPSFKRGFFMSLGFLLGTGAGNHMMAFFLLLPVFICLLNYKIRPREILFVFLGLLAGLLIYSYLPLRSLRDPVPDSGDPENLANFIWVMMRKQWGGMEWLNINAVSIMQGIKSLNIFGVFTAIGLFLALAGLINLYFKRRLLFVFTFLVFIFYSLGMIILIAGNLHPLLFRLSFIDEFFIPAYWVFVLWIGSGTLVLMKKKKVFIILPLFLVIFVFFSNVGICNFRNYTLPRDLGMKILSGVASDSVILSKGDDITFILMYLQEVEAMRRDVIVMDRSLLTWPVYFFQYEKIFPQLKFPDQERIGKLGDNKLILRELINDNISGRTIYWILDTDDPWIEDRIIPEGLVFRLSGGPIKMSDDVIEIAEKKWLEAEKNFLPWVDRENNRDGGFVIGSILHQMGVYFHRKKLYDKAIYYYGKAKLFCPWLDASSYNLGLIYWETGDLKNALFQFEDMVKYNPYSHDGYFNLGKVYEKMGDFHKAVSAYEKSKRVARGYADTYYHMANCYKNLGDIKKARRSYAKAVTINPDYKEAKDSIKEINNKD